MSKEKTNPASGPGEAAAMALTDALKNGPVQELEWEKSETPKVLADGSQTEDLRRFGTALALVQGEVKNAKKSQKNAHFKTSYADLVEITDAARPALARHLIAVFQIPMMDDQAKMFLRTRLFHGPSGQFIRGDYPMAAAAWGAAQAKVAEMTYARRASLACMVMIASEDDDDDGESIGDRDQQRPTDQGQDNGQPAPDSKNTREMKEWADWAAGRKIPKLKDSEELVAWEESVKAEIAALAKHAPEHHTKVKTALEEAAKRLGLPQAGQSDELGPHA